MGVDKGCLSVRAMFCNSNVAAIFFQIDFLHGGLICGTLGGGPRMHCDLTPQSAFIVRCNKRNALEKIDLNLTSKY
jgi:hypothetical protein